MRKSLPWWFLFALGMCLVPLFASNHTLRIFIFANYLAIFAMSWDVLSGYTGYISFGHPFLIGIAGYTTAMLTHHLDLPLVVSIPAAVGVTMAAGTLFFFPALRTKGTYFALVTLAFMEVTYRLMEVVKPEITGGTRGLTGLPLLTTGARPNFYVSFAVMFVIALGLWSISRSGMGAALSAIRMDEGAVRSVGLNTTKLKLFAFMLSALVAGIGGAFYTHYLGSISPRGMFDISFLFTVLIAALIGGERTILGPILGAYFLTFLLEYLRPYIPGAWRFLAYGVVALAVYNVAPQGLYSMIRRLVGWVAGRATGGHPDGRTA